MTMFCFYPMAFQAEGVLSLPASVCPSVNFNLFPRKTRHIFGLEPLNLHQICILTYSRLVLKMKVIELDIQGHFGHFNLKI